MAVIIGRNGRPTPLLEEFDIADSDRAAVNDLVGQMVTVLDEVDATQRSVILAALAELSTRYIQQPKPKRNAKGRAAS